MKHGNIYGVSGNILCDYAITKNEDSGGNNMNALGISLRAPVIQGMEVWLYKFKKNGVKKATFNRLLVTFNLASHYSIMNMRLIDISTIDVQSFINRLQADGYAYNTIKKAYNLISAYFKFLIGEGVAVRPSYINVTLPKPENTSNTRHIEAYSKPEQARLFKASLDHQELGVKAAILMLETGIRAGEALALSWRDVQWDRKALYIHKTVVNPSSTKKCFVQDSAKSKASKRTIALSKRAYNLLEEMYESAMPNSDDDMIFYRRNDVSLPLGYNIMREHIRRLCEEANVPYRGMHVFRHTFATNCYYKGCEIKILSKFLGHSSVTVTYNTYIHLYGDALNEMRSIVE